MTETTQDELSVSSLPETSEDYEELADAWAAVADVHDDDPVATTHDAETDHERVATRGPVLVDQSAGVAHDLTTGETLQLVSMEGEEETERELDVSLIYAGAYAAVWLMVAVSILLSPLSASQQVLLLAVDTAFVTERLWFEIRHRPSPVAPEGEIHASYTNLNNPDAGAYDPSRG